MVLVGQAVITMLLISAIPGVKRAAVDGEFRKVCFTLSGDPSTSLITSIFSA